jgi:hypothetical protein
MIWPRIFQRSQLSWKHHKMLQHQLLPCLTDFPLRHYAVCVWYITDILYRCQFYFTKLCKITCRPISMTSQIYFQLLFSSTNRLKSIILQWDVFLARVYFIYLLYLCTKTWHAYTQSWWFLHWLKIEKTQCLSFFPLLDFDSLSVGVQLNHSGCHSSDITH